MLNEAAGCDLGAFSALLNGEPAMDTQKPFRVYFVDDDHDTADSLIFLFKLWGFDDCRAFYSAEEAWRTACACHPSAMLIDIAMPGMDGLRLAMSIRQNPELKDILLVALTGYADAEHRRLAMQAGYDVFLIKPTDLDELKELLSKAREKRAGYSFPWSPGR